MSLLRPPDGSRGKMSSFSVRGMSVLCPSCEREYDVSLFQFGRTLDCTCGQRVGLAPKVRQSDSGTEPRFIVDAMLGRLVRWLRFLGLDATYEADMADRELVRRALEEDRVLLTRDRALAEEWSVPRILVLESDSLRKQMNQVIRAYRLDRPTRTFTRCSRCNTELVDMDRDEAAPSVPPRVLLAHRRFVRCESCDRVYWHGSHVDRMCKLLDQIFDGQDPSSKTDGGTFA